MHGLDEITVFAERLERLGAPYMVTGATAAIVYGQPRVTNDLDVVLALGEDLRVALLKEFTAEEFYVPPESVIRVEQARALRGHFNLIHLESGFKADIYLVGGDPLHRWALERVRRIPWGRAGASMAVAPPEYVVLRKLEFFREGGSTKHVEDIRAILQVTGVDAAALAPWLDRNGLKDIWTQVTAGS